MEIIKKILKSDSNLYDKPVTIAFLGDSVTHGCFDCFINEEGNIDTIFKPELAYSNRVREILHILYPKAKVNIVNSGISGDNSELGLKRLEQDVLSYNPDLVIVSYGLNDSCGWGKENVNKYKENLKAIFNEIKERNIECIFLTENSMAEKVSCHVMGCYKPEIFIPIVEHAKNVQNDGTLDLYFSEAKKMALECDVNICDIYDVYKTFSKNGVDVTNNLLANYINHPIKEMHYYTAIKLIETMMKD